MPSIKESNFPILVHLSPLSPYFDMENRLQFSSVKRLHILNTICKTYVFDGLSVAGYPRLLLF
jgi:hypothetical protein